MGIITTMLRQTAVYWPPLANPAGEVLYDAEGQRRYDSPVQIRCRWEDKQEEAVDAAGEKIMNNATVYVDRDVALGGLLRLGTLASMDYATDPHENTGVHEIRSFTKTPNLRATEYLRTASV